MKKGFVLFGVMALLFLMPFVYAADLEVEKVAREPVVVVGIDRPAVFDFSITNNDQSDTFQIYTLIAAYLEPTGFFEIASGETKEFEVLVHPHPETKESRRGTFVFDYEIKGVETGFFRDRITVRIVELDDPFLIEVDDVSPDDEEITFHITNREDFEFNDLSVEIDSDFFEFSEVIDIDYNETLSFSAPLKREEVKELSAGDYFINAELMFEDVQGTITQIEVNYIEGEGVVESTESSGFIIRDKTTTKTNEGNVPADVQITETKDALSRLFTTFSERPDTSDRRGLFVHYTWSDQIDPAESFSVTTTTNYTFPFLLLLFVVATTFIVMRVYRTSVVVTKDVSYIKTKGGEFALRVKVHVKSKKDITDVHIVDKLPPMVKVHEKFAVKPDKIDERHRKVHWHLSRINSGEERVFSYVIYSKINVVGRFEIPAADVSFKKDGKHQEISSNKAFFMGNSSARPME